MKPLLILSLLAICAGCKPEEPPQPMIPPNTALRIETSTSMAGWLIPDAEYADIIKAMRILAAHADPSPQVGSVNAVLLPRSESLMLAAKRQEAREAEYAWAKSVLAELEKRK